MSEITGIELGPDACVLVRTGRRGSRTTVAGVRTILPAEWADDRDGFTGALRKARRAQHLPARARVVAWGASAESALDVAPLSDLTPLLNAGFEMEAILTPAQALADLVRARVDSSANAVAAVAVNGRGAAIAVVHRGELIASRSFDWPLGPALRESRPALLERYLLVAQLAPQIQHLIELTRPVYGARVASVLVCGTLPNLRSLSMPLIEELDLEVETLDSADLLEPNLQALGDSVPALQLAAAAATPAAAATQKVTGRSPANAARGTAALSVLSAGLTTVWILLQLLGMGRAVPVFSAAEAAVMAAEQPDPVTPLVPDLRIEATIGRVGAAAALGTPQTASGRGADPRVPETAPTAASSPPPSPITGAPESLALPPLPRVDGIMISGNRSLAIVGGNAVAPGDRVGPRRVLRIHRDGVVLLEPSGREVFVAIRPQKPTGGGTDGRSQP